MIRSSRRSPRLGPVCLILRTGFHALLGLGLGILSSCAPHSKITRKEIDALPRSHVDVPGRPGWRLSYLHAGDADDPSVIYIHGTPGSADAWASYLAHPEAGLRAVAVDRLGFGKSIPQSPVTSFEDQAAAIAPLLVDRRGRQPIVVGHSLGGPIGARLAADYHDRVGALVILAGDLDPELEVWQWYNAVADFPLIHWLIPRVMAKANDEVKAAKEQTVELAEVLGRITCPVVIVHGEADELVPFANVAYMQKMFTGSRSVSVIAIPRQGHLLPWQQEPMIRGVIERLRDGGTFGNQMPVEPAR